MDAFTQASRSIGEPILGRPLNEISVAKLLGQLFQVTEQFGMETQPQLLLLQKTMVLAEGLGRMLAPDLNMWMLARPMIEDWMRANLGPEARIKRAAGDMAATIERLPRVLENAERTAAMFSSGGLKLHPDSVDALRGKSKGAKRNVSRALPWVLIVILVYLLLSR